jgi:hypothetical protein
MGAAFAAAAAIAFVVAGAGAHSGKTIIRVAGTPGVLGYTGDGGPARQAELHLPSDVSPLPNGGYLIADKKNMAVRMVTPSGKISTVAGTGTGLPGYNGDDRAAVHTQLNYPSGVAALSNRAFLEGDFESHIVRRCVIGGKCHIVAGTATTSGYSGDGHRATQAELNGPARVTPLSNGGFLIADFNNNVVRKVNANGIISTVAGTGTAGDTGDGGPATSAELDEPAAVSLLPGGGMLIPEYGGNVVRKVSSNGKIHTIAGTGTSGYNGDGEPAKQATLSQPTWAVQIGKSIYIADYANNRVRKITPDGKIHTAVGDGTCGHIGDGGPPKQAEVCSPTSVNPIPGGHGAYYISDFSNDTIRLVH